MNRRMYFGEWERCEDVPNKPSQRWVSPQEDLYKEGFFKVCYSTSEDVSELEANAISGAWREPAMKQWFLKLTIIENVVGIELFKTITGLGVTTIPMLPDPESDYKHEIELGTVFGWSREVHGWIFKIDDMYVLGKGK